MHLEVNRLSARERSLLIERRYSIEELTELHAMLWRAQQLRKRRLRIVAVMLPVLCLVMVALTASIAGWTPAVAFSGIVILAVCAVLLGIAWYASVGLYAQQFNDAVDEGYPELVSRLHL